MHRIVNRAPWKLRARVIQYFLDKHHIHCDGLPDFDGPWPHIDNEGELVLGAACEFRTFRLRQHLTVQQNARLEIGRGSFINDGVNICATTSVRIGHHAKIGDMTYIYDADFHEVAPYMPKRCAPVVIGNNVWIGAQSMVLAGAVIGDHSVIAAGSLVTGEIPPKCLAAGVPAKVIKTLEMPDDWLRS